MSQVAPSLTREPIIPAKRRAMTIARKRKIHGMRDGTCCDCGTPNLPLIGPLVVYHHWPPLGLLEEDTDERVYLRCRQCDDVGTPRDISMVAKAKRQGSERKPSARPLRSKGFFRHPTLKRGVDGIVRPR